MVSNENGERTNESTENPESATDAEKIAAAGIDVPEPGSPQRYEPDLETEGEKIAAAGIDVPEPGSPQHHQPDLETDAEKISAAGIDGRGDRDRDLGGAGQR